ncbi:MAG TPA: hypothetical protein ENJ40_05640 [Thermosulfurimonas dismutans]|uniref:Phage late control D family protein n=1 Tax=Thermosulfurimonas dismutans TaxID=999894 RepID=A0A7C3GT26_9BACT|nr:hypothetical protein [Thermosulfurimonas dismutans]
MEAVRRVRPRIKYLKKDITADLAPYLLSLTYTDYAHGKADDLEIRLADREGLWSGPWYPGKGDRIEVELFCENWLGSGRHVTLRCGVFEIDEIEASGPPSEVVVRAHSALVTKDLRSTKRTRAWENTSLRAIASEIAGHHGLQLIWDGPDVPYRRVDQTEEPDLAFLKRLCEAADRYLKLAHEKLIISEETAKVGGPLVGTIMKEGCKRFRLRDKTHRIFRACKVYYFDPERKELLEHVEEDPKAPASGETLVLNERCESLSQAIKRARAELSRRNRFETEGELVVPGDPSLVAGVSVELKDFGRLSGRYAVEESRHTYSRAGYETSLRLRRVRE